MGELNQSRALHNSILIGNEIMIVGGLADDSEVGTEVWDIENQSATSIGPNLHNYFAYPALFAVPADYCQFS